MIYSDLSSFTYFRGRVALYAILKALNIGKGDEVATQAFTCVAVPEGIMASCACPIYIDIESMGFNMDAGDLEQKITSKTRAIIVQHTYGIPADMDSLLLVAKRHRIPVIQTGSQFKNMKKFDKNFPFKAIIKVNKHFRYSFLGRMFCLFPILNLAINCDTV